MSFQVVTPAYELPISLTEAKKHFREQVDFHDEDPLIEAYIRAATSYAEEYTSLKFVTTTIKETRDNWPESMLYFPLSIGPVVEVESVKYYNTEGTLTTWNSTEYVVDLISAPVRIAPAPGCSFPSVQAARISPIEIIYKAGFGSADNVPALIKVAIQMITTYLYDHRDDEPLKAQGRFQAPRAADRLLNSYKTYSF